MGAQRAPDAWRVEVFRRSELDDPEGLHARAALRELGLRAVEDVRVGKGYLLSPQLGRATVERLAREILADPVLELARIDAPRTPPPGLRPAQHRLLVARRPGVMDPVALTVERAIARTARVQLPGGAPVRALTFRVLEVRGALAREELARAARSLFANEVIEELLVDREDLHFELPRAGELRSDVRLLLRSATDAELTRLSREGSLSLSLEEMRAIQAHYRALEREPTVCELETIAQTWSEHCKHKTFTGRIDYTDRHGTERIDNLLKRTIKAATVEIAAPWCVSVFHDNAGVVEFANASELAGGDGERHPGWDVCFKVETHNHPSAIDPYGGAGTGIGGVIRDILGVGLGARPIANTDAFFVGPLDLEPERVPEGCMHPRRILRGVVAGVRDYGNRMGIPTLNGGVWVDPRYVGNPLVYAGTVGLLPHDCVEKSVQPGDAIVVLGGRTGRDGIHGATFSSLELHAESSQVSSAAVQIGDPITEKRVLDALMQARGERLYRAITDCGAGGLSSAVGEMSAGHGAEVHLERVPLKYPGLSAAEIWISEAQERMVLAVPRERLQRLLEVCAAEDVEVSAIGEFTSSGKLVLRHRGDEVASLDLEFLHEGTPRPVRKARWMPQPSLDPGCPPVKDAARTLFALLSMPDVASKEWIVRQYDHEVQGTSVVKPLVGVRGDGPGDAAVLQPLADSRRGIALGCGASPRYGALDPWGMASAAIDEALRNVVAVGGDPSRTAILDNFSWGNCEREEQLGALVQAARACHATAVAFRTPFISGKDSLNNEYRVGGETIVIPPTLFVSALAIVPDVARSLTMDLKAPGNALYLVGRTHAELGGSHYLELAGLSGGRVPRPDLVLAPLRLKALHAAIAAGLARSCHDLSEGGLAVAAAEMAFAGGLGLDLDLASMPAGELPKSCDRVSTLLFSESCTRFLVEVAPEQCADFERLLSDHDTARVGRVTADPELVLRHSGAVIARASLDDLRRAHQGGFQG
jgi:phosphoribosylformylglycinamidine synthase subunit PurSL